MSESPDFILHVVEFRAAAVNASLSLNGVELIRSEADRPLMTQIKINGWMRYSGNELILRAGAPEQPKSKRPLDLKVNLFRGPHGRQPEESEALRRYELQDPKTVAPGEPVEIWKASFPSVPYYGPWEWERAVELHVGDALTSAVAAALNSVAVAIRLRCLSFLGFTSTNSDVLWESLRPASKRNFVNGRRVGARRENK